MKQVSNTIYGINRSSTSVRIAAITADEFHFPGFVRGV